MSALVTELLGRFRDTQDRWSVADEDGARVYVTSRAELHEAWLAEAFTGTSVSEGEEPIAVIMAGGPASGKSTLLEGHVDLPATYTKVDVDWFKTKIPEYVELVAEAEPRAAELVHEESSDLGTELRSRAATARHHLVIDQTGDSPSGVFADKLRSLANQGYRIDLVYADVPVDIAIERDMARWRKTGRAVGAERVRDLHAKVAARFQEVVRQPHVTRVRLYDCTDEPVLVLEGGRGDAPTVHDASRLKLFTAKGQS